jgi:primosomal replication protein N
MSGSLAESTSASERRAERRIRVRLPVEVRGTDLAGARFEERTTSENVCRGGVAFSLSRSIAVGADLDIHIPLRHQAHHEENDFTTQGRVCHVEASESGRLIGVKFTGPRFSRVFVSESPTEA